ncbi:MAG: hypothetical protein GYA50_10095 [Eubacteriaceae bacterium]|nr:hypothetical protein [Eubacteriaceae bacterium]
MVEKISCKCSDRYEIDIDSYSLYEELKKFFETEILKGIYEDIPVLKPILLFDDFKNVVTQWYPDKWYKCSVCGQLWAFEYPDFPAFGRIYKLDNNGIWHGACR